MKMFTELKRVYSQGYMNYVPNFQKTFPELKNLTREELADRFKSLGVEFYTAERKPIPILIRLTMPFAFVTAVSYTHLTLPTILRSCRSRWSPYH